MPSLSEGQSSVVLEGMAHGCIPIVSRESGVDLPPGVGFSVEARSIDSIVQACNSVIKSKEPLESASQGVRDHARQYSRTAWKERLADLLEEL